MTDSYVAPAIAAVTPVDEPIIAGPGGSPPLRCNPNWTEEPDES